jgi:hypothetical protein
VKPGWTAGVTRARLLLSRAIGREHARRIAGCRSLEAALGTLAGSAYGQRVPAGIDLHGAQRGVADTLLWHLRIMAGWLPPAGAALVRALAAWFELSNIDARLAALASDGREPPPFELGALATAWAAVEQARSLDEMMEAISTSPWGKVDGGGSAGLSIGLRVAWARRVQSAVPEAGRWVIGAGGLLVAREVLVSGRRAHVDQLRRLPGIGDRAVEAASLPDLRAALGEKAAWALAGIEAPRELWRAELGWWDQVERDAPGLLRTLGDEAVVTAAAALLAVDAQRTARALEAAARGGSPELVELVGGPQ